MALLLVQHGKSLPKDKDPAKGLSEEGISEVEHIAGIAKEYGVNVSHIMHSGKKELFRLLRYLHQPLNLTVALKKLMELILLMRWLLLPMTLKSAII